MGLNLLDVSLSVSKQIHLATNTLVSPSVHCTPCLRYLIYYQNTAQMIATTSDFKHHKGPQ